MTLSSDDNPVESNNLPNFIHIPQEPHLSPLSNQSDVGSNQTVISPPTEYTQHPPHNSSLTLSHTSNYLNDFQIQKTAEAV